MHAVIRRYNTAQGAAAEIADRVNAEFVPIINQAPGFIAYYVVESGDGTLLSVSVFEDRAGSDESTKVATAWVRQNLGHKITTAPIITSGTVVAHSSTAAAPR